MQDTKNVSNRPLRETLDYTAAGWADPATREERAREECRRPMEFLHASFQENCPKDYREFPPGSVWLVYTDMVPHAMLSGQYALEQTFLVHPEAMITPEKAPIRIIEKMTGASLAY